MPYSLGYTHYQIHQNLAKTKGRWGGRIWWTWVKGQRCWSKPIIWWKIAYCCCGYEPVILCHNFSKMMYICNCIVHVSHNLVFATAVSLMFFLFPRLEHPAGWICARYKSLLLLLLLFYREGFVWTLRCISWQWLFLIVCRFVEKGNLEVLLFTIQSKMRANNQRAFTPKEGKLVHDINKVRIKKLPSNCSVG